MQPKGWQNPYDREGSSTQNHTRKAIANENWLKVQKRRAEARFTKGMRSNNFQLAELERIREQVLTEDRQVQYKEKPKRQIAVSALDREGYRRVQQFGSNIRCMELTQGGATIWTAENDGTITIRSGNQGRIVHQIPMETEGVTVDVLYATPSHMWCGLSDGNVIVYDHMVFLHVTEGKFHTKGVTGFCQTPDGRTFSASADGSLVKWDTEAKNFEAMTKILIDQENSITSLAADVTFLFAGGADGSIRCIDYESGEVVRSLEGHDEEVVNIVAVDGTLFSASAGTIKAWTTSDGTCMNVWKTEVPTVSLSVDSSSHRLWVGRNDGVVEIWRTLSEDGFSVEKTLSAHEGQGIAALKNYSTIDSLKLWSLSSNGVNKVWYSSVNRVEAAMNETIAALKAVILQDTIELDKWRALVYRLRMIDNRRKYQLAHALEASTHDTLRRRYQWQWKQYVRHCHARSRQKAIAKRLEFEGKVIMSREFFSKWYRWYRAAQNLRLKTKYADLLMRTSTKSVVHLYYRKMQIFARKVKEAQKKRDLTGVLGRHNNMYLLRLYFRKLLKYRQSRKLRSTKLKYAGALLRTSLTSLMRLYYVSWATVAQRKVINERKQKFGELLLKLTVNGLRLSSFKKWHKYLLYMQDLRRKQKLGAALLTNTERGTQSIFWAKFVLLYNRAQKRKLEAAKETAQKDLAYIKEKYKALNKILEKKKKLDELREQIRIENEALDERRHKYDQLQAAKDKIIDELADQDMENIKKQESVQEQMEDLITRLKAKALNYYLDHSLISQLHEKAKQMESTKIFLEAHQNVKRVVVDLTHKPHCVNEEWPLTNEMLTKMPSHQVNVVLQSIKTMIITFDMMSKETRDGINTDQEIVLNARWLLVMADICQAYRKKTLSKNGPVRRA